MKSGTTTLAHYLSTHQELHVPKDEVHYFDYSKNYKEGEIWYHDKLGIEKNSDKIIGEKTPYSFYPETAERIYNYNKDIKLIWILRNPVDRAFSNYKHDLYNVDEWRNFEKCVRREEKRDLLYQYLSKGKYIEQVENYLKYFDLKQMHFVIYEEFFSNMEEELNKMKHFLGLKADFIINKERIHSKQSKCPKYSPVTLYYYKNLFGTRGKIWNWLWKINFNSKVDLKMNEKIRINLLDYFSGYNDRLEKLISKDLTVWKK